MEFWDGNLKLGEDSTPPFTRPCSGPLGAGINVLKTLAHDNDGRVTTSNSVDETVIPLKLDLNGFTTNGTPLLRIQMPPGRHWEREIYFARIPDDARD